VSVDDLDLAQKRLGVPLERLSNAERHDPETGADPETGELPWDGFKDGRIQNFLGLDWAGEKLAEYERAMLENMAALAAAIKRLEDRVGKIQGPLMKKIAFWNAAIETYAKEHRADLLVGRNKTRALPSGVVLKWRTQKAGYRWDQSKTPAENKAALLAWLDGRGLGVAPWAALVREPNIAAVKDYLWRNAQDAAPPGLEYISAAETLTVSVGEEESR
jgi:hypothetical protein